MGEREVGDLDLLFLFGLGLSLCWSRYVQSRQTKHLTCPVHFSSFLPCSILSHSISPPPFPRLVPCPVHILLKRESKRTMRRRGERDEKGKEMKISPCPLCHFSHPLSPLPSHHSMLYAKKGIGEEERSGRKKGPPRKVRKDEQLNRKRRGAPE